MISILIIDLKFCCRTQVLNIKDLRRSDTGNFTCELFNSFGTINATYILIVTGNIKRNRCCWNVFILICLEKLQFYGNDPQNISVEIGKPAILQCRVQTNDPKTKIQWLKKLINQELFRPDAIVLDSEQYEIIDQTHELQYSNNILSKSLIISQLNPKQSGEYICLIQNDKATNYKKSFINLIEIEKSK